MTISQAIEFQSPAHTQPTHKLDLEMFTFIERYATNLARWDVLVFFGQHPTAASDAAQIAQRVGRGARMVQKELDDLVYLGVLHARHDAQGTLYGLARSAATRRNVIRLARDYTVRL